MVQYCNDRFNAPNVLCAPTQEFPSTCMESWGYQTIFFNSINSILAKMTDIADSLKMSPVKLNTVTVCGICCLLASISPGNLVCYPLRNHVFVLFLCFHANRSTGGVELHPPSHGAASTHCPPRHFCNHYLRNHRPRIIHQRYAPDVLFE